MHKIIAKIGAVFYWSNVNYCVLQLLE